MKQSPFAVRWKGWLILAMLPILAAASGCGGGQDVTPESIAQAKQLWTSASIHNYDLEWTVAGTQTNHYYVTVRSGEVRKVESVLGDGKRITLKPGDPRYYSVDGLFLTMSVELAQLKTDRPFDQPKDTKVVMRFKAEPKLGYPEWYRRDVMGSKQALAIDVIKLIPEQPPESTSSSR